MSILALLQTFIISVNEVMFYPAFVRLSVCLSVSNFTLKLLIGSSQKNIILDYYYYFGQKERRWILEVTRFGSGSRNFLNDSLTLRDVAFFHNLTDISGKLIRSSWKLFTDMYLCMGKSHWILEVFSDVCTLQVVLFALFMPFCCINCLYAYLLSWLFISFNVYGY